MSPKNHPAWCWVLSDDYIAHLSAKRWTLKSIYCRHEELTGFFHTPNVVFFHTGSHERELLEELRPYEKVICNVGDPQTLQDADRQIAKAEALSKLSRDFPNVVGGIVDDLTTAVQEDRLSPEIMARTHAALKSHNPALQLQAVAYAGDLQLDLSAYLPFIDSISLWVWKASDLGKLDGYVKQASDVFEGKPISLGLYLYDYGDACDTLPIETVKFQFSRAGQYLQEGLIEGFHILGSYLKAELDTAQALWAADFVAQIAR